MLVGVLLARAARNWDDRLEPEHAVPNFHGGDVGGRHRTPLNERMIAAIGYSLKTNDDNTSSSSFLLFLLPTPAPSSCSWFADHW